MEIVPGIRHKESYVKMPLMKLPAKEFWVDVRQGLVLISPLPSQERDPATPLTDIVAPNLFHNLGVSRATKQFPQAKLWGADGFKEKLPQFEWAALDSSWPYADQLAPFKIDGMPGVNEVVFFHRASRSLIVTDLCFNYTTGKGFGYWLFFNLFGTYRKFAVSRLYKTMIKDKAAFCASMQKIMALEFENILLPHGDHIIGMAKEKLTQALKKRGLDF